MTSDTRLPKMTVVFEDRELYRSVKVAAAERGTTVKAIVAEALREWLERREDEAAARLLEEAMAEAGDDPGIPWSDFKRDLAEHRERSA